MSDSQPTKLVGMVGSFVRRRRRPRITLSLTHSLTVGRSGSGSGSDGSVVDLRLSE